MALVNGTRLGPYEILAAIGAGGMGEVYRARDTKLGRDVAIKILPDLFVADPERVARFAREAKTLAALNHPHIAQIHGLEESTGVSALVMELVEGPTLAERIGRGAISIDEALPIARQIAEALEAAHEHGVVHRDLKPANIKVTPDGAVKVLDFGLAKAIEGAGVAGGTGGDDLANSPTMTSPAMTRAGIILGTAAYMSPEQARGAAVDKRADIWAFGCVLYELLAGRKCFAGQSVTDVLAAVVRAEPDWNALPSETPSRVRELLARCLRKDAKQRLHDVGDARMEIEDALAGAAEQQLRAATPEGVRRWTIALPWTIAATVAVAVTALAIQMRQPRAPAAHQSVTRLDLTLPPGVELYRGNAPVAALSPDGGTIVFVGVLGGARQLYVRRLDQFEASPLRGTAPRNPGGCFFSPDGRAVGFISTDQVLSRVTLADSLVATVVRDADFTAGAAWGADGRITFVRGGALWQVASAGGTPQRLTTLDAQRGEVSHRWPTSVRDGQVILFASVTGGGQGASHLEALSVPTGQRRILVESGTFPMFASSGYLIFFRDGALLAAPFDVERLEVTGSPIRVLENVSLDTNGAPLAAVSGTGSLVYLTQRTEASRLVWVSRQGLEQPLTGASRSYALPRLSPDGRRIAVGNIGHVWIQDMARSTFTRLTSDESTGNNWPVWTPDGKRVVFRTLTGLRWIDADGSGRSQPIPGTSVVDYPGSISPDGDTLAFLRLTADRSSDVYVLSLNGELQPRPLLNTPAYEGGAQFSPDGRWMAYVSTESGQMEVYVRPFPGPDRKWQVSTEGGTSPLWSRNGRELFYRNANRMMAVGVSTSPELTLSQPRLLFEQRYAFGSATTTPNYDVSLDGQHFVMVKDESGSGSLNVVLNWFEELKARVPATK